jgi:hypothetical protein
MYVANKSSSTISVLRDSGGAGVAGSPKPQAPSRKLAATVVRSLPVGAIAFNAMGRRVVNAKPGVYFVWDEGRGAGVVGRVRKVVVQR